MTSTPMASDLAREALEPGLTIAALQRAHAERQKEWCPDQKPDLSFRGNEMAGEVGEACNVIKKLERERHGWRGSRATVDDLGDELADTIHTAVLCAITAGIADLEARVVGKFNATSEKNGLATLLSTHTAAGAAPVEEADAKAGEPIGWLKPESAHTLEPRFIYAKDRIEDWMRAVFTVPVYATPPAPTIPSEPEVKGESGAEQTHLDLGNLLAIVHRDGGHYQHEHDTAKAVDEAHRIIAGLFARSEEAGAVPVGEAVAVHAYAQEYEFRMDDGGGYTPTEGERAMIEDAITGFLSETARPSTQESSAALAGDGKEGGR